MIKVNVDAAVTWAGDKGVVDIICRYWEGKYLAASLLVSMEITDPETLEVMTCNEALVLAEVCGLRDICEASDCTNAAKNIKDMPRYEYMMILQDIKEKENIFDRVHFVHEARESNSKEHNSTQFACTLEPSRHMWLDVPPNFLDVTLNVMSK